MRHPTHRCRPARARLLGAAKERIQETFDRELLHEPTPATAASHDDGRADHGRRRPWPRRILEVRTQLAQARGSAYPRGGGAETTTPPAGRPPWAGATPTSCSTWSTTPSTRPARWCGAPRPGRPRLGHPGTRRRSRACPNVPPTGCTSRSSRPRATAPAWAWPSPTPWWPRPRRRAPPRAPRRHHRLRGRPPRPWLKQSISRRLPDPPPGRYCRPGFAGSRRTMTYTLGIDLGTTYTAAAVHRDGRAEVVTLGYRASVGALGGVPGRRRPVPGRRGRRAAGRHRARPGGPRVQAPGRRPHARHAGRHARSSADALHGRAAALGRRRRWPSRGRAARRASP